MPFFEVVPSGVDETPPVPLPPLRSAQWAAQQKARTVAADRADAMVIAADTIVVLGSRRFGKPRDAAMARAMLAALSGRAHLVYTAAHVINTVHQMEARGFARTVVTMRTLSPAQIEAYVRSGEPRDKAGAYAIQGRGCSLVAAIDGPFDNVVGMPMTLVRRLLRRAGLELPPG